MKVVVLFLVPKINKNQSDGVLLTSVERSISIDVGMTSTWTMVMHRNSVVVAVVHIDIH